MALDRDHVPLLTPLGAVLTVILILGWGAFLYTHTHPTTRTVTVTTSPSCLQTARTWQQIALRESRVATLAATGHGPAAGVEAQRTLRFVHSALTHHLIRTGPCR